MVDKNKWTTRYSEKPDLARVRSQLAEFFVYKQAVTNSTF